MPSTFLYVQALLTGTRGTFSIYHVLFGYFWLVWLIKAFLSFCIYKPAVATDDELASTRVSVVVPTYKEDIDTLSMSVRDTLHPSNTTVTEVIIVTDTREKNFKMICMEKWADEPRVCVIESPVGKRKAVRLGIDTAREDIVMIIESDTFAEKSAVDELIKPLIRDEKVGGVVGLQLIYQPFNNSISFFNNLIEIIKYMFTVPALSVFGQTTVLGGRCVAFKKQAVAATMDSLEFEKLLGKPCVSGDDGRVTSLLLCMGWRCVYQKTALFLTVSPPNLSIFMKQRLRWARNSCRRTLRAIFAIKEPHLAEPYDRFWMYKKPAAMFQIFSVWTNTTVMSVVVVLTVASVLRREWLWLGTDKWEILLRVILFLVVGMALRRTFRVFPACGMMPFKYAPWLFFLPWYLLLMWVMRLYAICSMNKQGWVTRVGTGAGGFGRAPEADSTRFSDDVPGAVDMPEEQDRLEWGLSLAGNDDTFVFRNPIQKGDVCTGFGKTPRVDVTSVTVDSAGPVDMPEEKDHVEGRVPPSVNEEVFICSNPIHKGDGCGGFGNAPEIDVTNVPDDAPGPVDMSQEKGHVEWGVSLSANEDVFVCCNPIYSKPMDNGDGCGDSAIEEHGYSAF